MRDNPVAAASQGVNVGRLRFLIWIAAAVGTGLAGAIYFMAQLRITPPSAYDPNWANIAIFIVMVGGLGSLEGVLIGALIYFFADRWFGEYGATYLVVLGLLTLFMALFARGGIWGLICKVVDAPWFPTRRTLLEDRQMKAAIFDGVGQPLRVDDLQRPEPAEDEVLLRVAACGICGSDLHITEDPVTFGVGQGTVLGHEFAGEVVALRQRRDRAAAPATGSRWRRCGAAAAATAAVAASPPGAPRCG